MGGSRGGGAVEKLSPFCDHYLLRTAGGGTPSSLRNILGHYCVLEKKALTNFQIIEMKTKYFWGGFKWAKMYCNQLNCIFKVFFCIIKEYKSYIAFSLNDINALLKIVVLISDMMKFYNSIFNKTLDFF